MIYSPHQHHTALENYTYKCVCVQINGVECSHLVEFHVLLLHDGLVAPAQTMESDMSEC